MGPAQNFLDCGYEVFFVGRKVNESARNVIIGWGRFSKCSEEVGSRFLRGEKSFVNSG
jgi:hypothetical protein